jgi:hypothetical protein
VSKVTDDKEAFKLAGSVNMVNSTAESMENYQSLTMDNSTIGDVVNVQKVTVSKGSSSIDNYIGTNGKDTFTVSKNAVLYISGNINFEYGDKFVNNGTVIFGNAATDLDALAISGKGEFAAAADVWQDDWVDMVLNLGETSENFRGTKYELADDDLKKAVKWDMQNTYSGWLGSWDEDFDNIDYIKFKTDRKCEIAISGDNLDISFITNGRKAEYDELKGTYILAAGTEYTVKLKHDEELGSISYSLELV